MPNFNWKIRDNFVDMSIEICHRNNQMHSFLALKEILPPAIKSMTNWNDIREFEVFQPYTIMEIIEKKDHFPFFSNVLIKMERSACILEKANPKQELFLDLRNNYSCDKFKQT